MTKSNQKASKGAWALPILAASALALSSGAGLARDFTVTTWGGAVAQAKYEIFFEPFANETDTALRTDVYAGGWAPFKAMQDTGVIPWDVIQVETAEMDRGCEEGIFSPIDWQLIGDQSEFIPAAVAECGVGTVVWSMVVSYNAAQFDEAPQQAADFWNLEKWPGKRGMRQGPKVNLEFALMADGVAPDEVYEVLATQEGIDRAFAKLDEIKPQVQWWKSGAQAPEWLVSGDVAMSMAYNGRIAVAIGEGRDLGIIWENTLYDADFWVIPAKSPYIDKAHDFIRYTSDAGRQATFSNAFAYGPTVSAAATMTRPEQQKLLPAGANIATGLHIGSPAAREFWADNLETLSERWNAWVSR